MMKEVFVINNHTGTLYAVIVGYQTKWKLDLPILAEKITQLRQYGEWGQHEQWALYFDGKVQVLDSHNYSVVYNDEVAQ